LAGGLRAQDACISDVIITKYQNTAYLYFNIKGCYNPEIEELVNSGVTTTFIFHVRLKQLRGMWFNTLIEEKTFKHTIKYDPLSGKYTITKEEDGKNPIIVADFEDAKSIMSRVKFYPLIPLELLEKGNTYRLEIKGELDKVHIPESLRYVLFFAHFWNFETDWYEEVFTY
jgi:hypothetical protein